MLVTEEDAVMKKWCPMIRLRWEERTFAFNRSNPGPKARWDPLESTCRHASLSIL